MSRFNLVHQFDRFSIRRDHVIPSPRDHRIRRQTQHSIGDGIAMVVVVKKPGVDIAFAQGRLNGSQVHEQTTILNKTRHLSESGRDLRGYGPQARPEVEGWPAERSSAAFPSHSTISSESSSVHLSAASRK